MKKIAKTKYPEKTSINLLINDDQQKNSLLPVLLFILFLLLLGIFTKFGVIDKLQDASEARNAYQDMQSQISSLQEENKDYEQVRQKYSHYGNGYLKDDEISQVDRMETLKLIEEYVLSKSDIESITIQGNTVTLQIGDTKLSTVSSMVEDLENDPMVQYVTVSTAGTDNTDNSNKLVRALMIISIQQGGEA